MPPTWGFNPKVKLNLKPTGIVKIEIVQNATAREYTRRCNTVENIHIHEIIGPYRDTELSSSKRRSQL